MGKQTTPHKTTNNKPPHLHDEITQRKKVEDVKNETLAFPVSFTMGFAMKRKSMKWLRKCEEEEGCYGEVGGGVRCREEKRRGVKKKMKRGDFRSRIDPKPPPIKKWDEKT
ncbi:hypothetical protein MTR_3g013970 [Medicago truncatula]|uniref:Uncharacterized protein n=1 Tax=Medicago truncatula TaxID=3880 RepID=G7IYP8_MEDTR|nr:hypothetical protein MTR_3g013970 [Medicago truncatula]